MNGPGKTLRVGWTLTTAAAILLALAGDSDALPRVRRYIGLTASPMPLDLGTVSAPGTYDSAAVLSMHLAANCNHGGTIISTSGLQREGGGQIPPERIHVRLPDTGQYVSLVNPVAVAPAAAPGLQDFQLRFRLLTEPADPAGTYTGTFSFITEGGAGWPAVPGPSIPVTLELEIAAGYELVGGKCYFHIGNIFTAAEQDLTIHATGSLTTNAGMFIGLNLSAMGHISDASLERNGSGHLTGRIMGGMIGTIDVLGRNISEERIDISILLSWDGGGTHRPPDYFGSSPDGNVHRTVWWLVNEGNPGIYALDWKVRLFPQQAQADGNYYFESELVVAPVL